MQLQRLRLDDTHPGLIVVGSPPWQIVRDQHRRAICCHRETKRAPSRTHMACDFVATALQPQELRYGVPNIRTCVGRRTIRRDYDVSQISPQSIAFT